MENFKAYPLVQEELKAMKQALRQHREARDRLDGTADYYFTVAYGSFQMILGRLSQEEKIKLMEQLANS